MQPTEQSTLRVLIGESEHALYADLLRQQAPKLELVGSADVDGLAHYAPSCSVWLGQPDLLATLMRRGACPRPADDLCVDPRRGDIRPGHG